MNATLNNVFGPMLRKLASAKVYDIGLHIGLDRVNLLQLHMPSGASRPAVRAAISIDHATTRDELLANPIRLKALVKRALSEQPFRGNRVVTCLPNDSIKFMLLNYTLTEGVSEGEAVVRELRERVHEEIEGMVVDYIPLRQEHPSRPKEAIVAMAARVKVTAYLDALAKAGLEVAALDIAPAALARLMSWVHTDNPAAHPNLLLINFGSRSSYLTVIWGRRLMLDRSIEFAEQRLLARLHTILDIPEDSGKRLLLERGFSSPSGSGAADELTDTLKEVLRPEFAKLRTEVGVTLQKPGPVPAQESHAPGSLPPAVRPAGPEKSSGDDPRSYTEIGRALKEVLRPEFATLKAEVDNTLVYTASRAHGRTVDEIYVVGSIARYPGIEHLLREQFSLPLQVLDPFIIFKHRLSEKELAWMWPHSGIAAAAGLALRGVPVHWPI